MEDSIRKQYTKQDITIIDKNYNHKANVISRNQYKFRNENGCITYQKGFCGDCGTLMFILETNGSLAGALNRDIINFGNIQVKLSFNKDKYDLCWNGLNQSLEQFKSYLIILNWNRPTFTTEMHIYNYTHPKNIPVYSLRPEMYYMDYENPLCELVGVYNNEFISESPLPCQIHSYPCNITNIKYYNTYLDKEESIKESIKYVTHHKSCIINDLARPINNGHGYSVK